MLFTVSWDDAVKYDTVQGLNGLKCAVVSCFRVEYLIPQTYEITWRPCRIDNANVGNLTPIITELCNNLEHLSLTR